MGWFLYNILGKQILVIVTLYKVYLIYQKFLIAYDLYLWGVYGINLITKIFLSSIESLPVKNIQIKDIEDEEYLDINTSDEIAIGPEYFVPPSAPYYSSVLMK